MKKWKEILPATRKGKLILLSMLINAGAFVSIFGIFFEPTLETRVSLDYQRITKILDVELARVKRQVKQDNPMTGGMINRMIDRMFTDRDKKYIANKFKQELEQSIRSGEISLIQMTKDIWNQGQPGIAILIVGFGLGFPILKVLMCFWLAIFPGGRLRRKPYASILEYVSRFSFMDVFVVAIMIVVLKSESLMVIEIVPRAGLWWLSSSALLSLISFSILLNMKE